MDGKASNIDLSFIVPGVLITLLVGIIITIFPVQGKAVVDSFGILTRIFKWAFLIFGLFCALFLIWLAISRWSDITLGGPDDEPELSTFFCEGIGIAIVYWAFIQPVYYLNSSILHIDLESQKGLVG